MFTAVTAQLSTPTLLRLIEYLRTRSGSKDVSEALDTALAFWLDAKSELPHDADPTSIRGYQWKSLFLPEGLLRKAQAEAETKPDDRQMPIPAIPVMSVTPPATPTPIPVNVTAATSTAPAAAPPTPRESVQKSDFDPGWDVPERRKFRYRMEDIAY